MHPYRHRFLVRYAEADQQGVVFNAHYLTYCDTAIDFWWRSLGLGVGDREFDCMVVKAVVEWQGSAKYAEELDIEVFVSRWGKTSFDVTCNGTVGERSIFAAVITYVGVRRGTTDTLQVPDAMKSALGGPA